MKKKNLLSNLLAVGQSLTHCKNKSYEMPLFLLPVGCVVLVGLCAGSAGTTFGRSGNGPNPVVGGTFVGAQEIE